MSDLKKEVEFLKGQIEMQSIFISQMIVQHAQQKKWSKEELAKMFSAVEGSIKEGEAFQTISKAPLDHPHITGMMEALKRHKEISLNLFSNES